jgi:hypothetical protein
VALSSPSPASPALPSLPDFVPVPKVTADSGKRPSPADEEEPSNLGDDLANVSLGYDDRSKRGKSSRVGGQGRAGDQGRDAGRNRGRTRSDDRGW